jgi:uncharacterized protein YndB with AHSA1/START domain
MPHEVRITRRLVATPDEVYDAWTNPQSVMEWMIPMPGGRTTARLESRVGGRFQIDMVSEGRTYPHEGEYLRLERPRLIEFTWISMATNRQRSVVTVELRPMADGGTELSLIHRQLPTEAAAQEHRGGWTAALGRLTEMLSRARRP